MWASEHKMTLLENSIRFGSYRGSEDSSLSQPSPSVPSSLPRPSPAGPPWTTEGCEEIGQGEEKWAHKCGTVVWGTFIDCMSPEHYTTMTEIVQRLNGVYGNIYTVFSAQPSARENSRVKCKTFRPGKYFVRISTPYSGMIADKTEVQEAVIKCMKYGVLDMDMTFARQKKYEDDPFDNYRIYQDKAFPADISSNTMILCKTKNVDPQKIWDALILLNSVTTDAQRDEVEAAYEDVSNIIETDFCKQQFISFFFNLNRQIGRKQFEKESEATQRLPPMRLFLNRKG